MRWASRETRRSTCPAWYCSPASVAASRAAAVARVEAERLRGHLLVLDEVLAGVGQSAASLLARRIVDQALGRAVEACA